MPALTPEFLFDLESNMRVIAENEYERLNKNLWWTNVAKEMNSESKKERISWFLDTAKIERTTKYGGEVHFEDLVAQTTEYENENASAGLEMKKEQLEDLDGNGVNLATHWSRGMGSYAAYWPQKEVARVLKANPTTYDGIAFFSPIGAPHPVNPFKPSGASFANDLTGVAAGAYPGAVPIDSSVTVDVALQNLVKAVAYIATFAMPNGEDPRQLRVKGILHPPALTARAQQLTNAKFIAQAASSGGGSGDVEAIIRNMGFGEPIQADELSAAFTNGSDTTYYLIMEEITGNELGAFAYVNREPFSILWHGEMDDAKLARMRKLQWLTEGRNVVGAGHPYLMVRCQGT